MLDAIAPAAVLAFVLLLPLLLRRAVVIAAAMLMADEIAREDELNERERWQQDIYESYENGGES